MLSSFHLLVQKDQRKSPLCGKFEILFETHLTDIDKNHSFSSRYLLKEKEVAENKSNEKNENDSDQKKKHDEKKEDMTENKCDEKNGNDDDQKKENDEKKDDKDNTQRKNENYYINKLIFLSCLFFSPFIQLFLLTGILAVGAMHKRSEELVRMASLLGLIETTFESAPQIIVQIFINIENTDDGETKSKYFRYITLVGSVLGLAKSMYNFKHDVEKGDRSKLTLPTKILSFLSRIAEIGPRVIILALFVSEFRFYSVIFFAVHILITFGIAFVAGYNNGVLDAFEREREIMLLLLGSFANTFFFCKYKLYENVKEEMQSRITIMFYMFYYIENAVLITLWCAVTRDKDVWYFYASIAVAIGALPLHITLFKGYLYLKFHQRRYRTKNGYTTESDGIENKS
ncbi:uncharacterized protein LOC134254372 isoform X2 [Saccostrea cucullata]|uniref:uncharacterized protein LOC134254372 isoform X2 n=1 Tax=Saccostrea cuccullata TaxID=36930 RepID=UPI002ED6A4EF